MTVVRIGLRPPKLAVSSFRMSPIGLGCVNALFAAIGGVKIPCDWRGQPMKRFVEGVDRGQSSLFPDRSTIT
jgi:hypothetical protein